LKAANDQMLASNLTLDQMGRLLIAEDASDAVEKGIVYVDTAASLIRPPDLLKDSSVYSGLESESSSPELSESANSIIPIAPLASFEKMTNVFEKTIGKALEQQWNRVPKWIKTGQPDSFEEI
jgi:hypothetical protein